MKLELTKIERDVVVFWAYLLSLFAQLFFIFSLVKFGMVWQPYLTNLDPDNMGLAPLMLFLALLFLFMIKTAIFNIDYVTGFYFKYHFPIIFFIQNFNDLINNDNLRPVRYIKQVRHQRFIRKVLSITDINYNQKFDKVFTLIEQLENETIMTNERFENHTNLSDELFKEKLPATTNPEIRTFGNKDDQRSITLHDSFYTV